MLTVNTIIGPTNEMFEEVISRLKICGKIPLNYSDSDWGEVANGYEPTYRIGDDDLKIISNLFAKGETMWISYPKIGIECVAPLYYWSDWSMYGKAEGGSYGETLLDKPFTKEDFSFEGTPDNVADIIVDTLNTVRSQYFENPTEENRKKTIVEILKLLPMSYNERRSFFLSYEDAAKIILCKRNDKFKEWRQLANELIALPYMYRIVGGD